MTLFMHATLTPVPGRLESFLDPFRGVGADVDQIQQAAPPGHQHRGILQRQLNKTVRLIVPRVADEGHRVVNLVLGGDLHVGKIALSGNQGAVDPRNEVA